MLSLTFTLSYSILWSFCYFWCIFYVFGVFITLTYLISNVKTFFNYTRTAASSQFTYLTGFDLYWFLLTPITILFLLNFSWVSPSISGWFGHVMFTSMQYKMTYLLTTFFLMVWTLMCSSLHFSSKDVYDFMAVTYSMFVWLVFLFYSNNLFTLIFFIEVLSTLIMLLIVTSTFSNAYFYNNLNLTSHNFFTITTPLAYLNSIIFFFWVSLIGSLNLFFFLILFFIKFLSFDWFVIELVFSYVTSTGLSYDILFNVAVWFNIVFCIFLKCGLPPFFFWKPTFFKGLPIHTLFFYVFFFYFFIFTFFIFFFLNYFSDLFYFNSSVLISILFIGLLLLTCILCESYYLKVFIAMSSILNSLFIFLILASVSTVDLVPQILI